MSTHGFARLAALSAVATLALAGCTLSETTATDSPSADSVAAPEPSPPSPPPAPEVDPDMAEPPHVPEQLQFTTATLADGAVFEGASLAGQDTILWYWAPWCPVCQAESPHVVAAAAQLPNGVTMYGVPGRADEPAMLEFVEAYGVDGFEHIVDADGSIWASFGITYQPAFVFINDDGSVRTFNGGMSTEAVLAEAEALANS